MTDGPTRFVVSADRPRADVAYPPFADAVGVARFEEIALGGPPGPTAAVRLALDCAAVPAAAAFLAGAVPVDGGVATSVGMRAHETGNGYVVLGVRPRGADDGPGRGRPDRATGTGADDAAAAERVAPLLEVVLDPEAHALVVELLIRVGFVQLTDAADTTDTPSGWTLDVERASLRRMADAAAKRHRAMVLELPRDR